MSTLARRGIQAGDPVLILNADGEWVKATAASDVRPTHSVGDRRRREPGMVRVHDFPVIYVYTGKWRRKVPWPAKDVRPDRPCADQESFLRAALGRCDQLAEENTRLAARVRELEEAQGELLGLLDHGVSLGRALEQAERGEGKPWREVLSR